MTGMRLRGLILLLVSSGFSSVWAVVLQRMPHDGIPDFKIIYIASRCLVQHRDPYKEAEFLRVFEEEGGKLPNSQIENRKFQDAVMAVVYLPSALLFVAPFATLSWTAAHALWTIATIGVFTFACCLIWSVASDFSSSVSTVLFAIVLANMEVLFAFGNAAGISIGLCAVAVWTFCTKRFALPGALCLAASLAIKPHDSVAIWLYFVLAGGCYRNRAVQALIAVTTLCVLAMLWVTYTSPDWMQEMLFNLHAVGTRGGIADPGPSGASSGTGGMLINLQTVFSIFSDDPGFYNAATYLLCAPLLLAWLIATLRTRKTRAMVWLALAALIPLSLLPVYHRTYDAKILFLLIPACALMWNRGGPRRWIALTLTTAALIITSDIPGTIIVMLNNALTRYPVGVSQKLVTIVLTRPVPLVLLAVSIFYLWEYIDQAGIIQTFSSGFGRLRQTNNSKASGAHMCTAHLLSS